MRRAQQNSTGRLRAAAWGLGLVAVLGAAGCSAGQIAQTADAPAAVNGAVGGTGPIAVRDAQLAFPQGSTYRKGAAAPLVLTIVNSGAEPDELLEVTSPAAESVELTGDRNLPGGTALMVGTPGKEASAGTSAPATTTTPKTTGSPSTAPSQPGGSSAPATSGSNPAGSSAAAPTSASPSTSASVTLGKLEIVLTGLTESLTPGRTVSVTFVFAKAGPVTLDLPIAAPTEPRTEEAHAGGE